MLSSLSAIITVLTLFFGGAFLRALQKTYGSLAYWATGTLLCLAFWQLQSVAMIVLIAGLWISLGLHLELEKRGVVWWVNGMASLFAGFAVIWLGGISLLKGLDIATDQSRKDLLKDLLSQVQMASPGIKLDAEVLFNFLPSAVAIILIFHLGLGLIFEKRVFHWFQLPRERYVSQVNMLEIKWPDFFLWVALTSLLLTAVNFGNQTLLHTGQNLVAVFSVLYFFQGLAITEFLLRTVKAGFFLRFMTYFIFVGHLFFVLSIVGFIDFWLDLRQRMRKSKQLEKTDNSI